jgi:lambda repressor-like predicted transcriptional regulator
VSGPNWQDNPDWLVFAVRASHALARQSGEKGAGEEDVARLADKVLRDDPEFARLVIARHVRTLVLAPAAKRRKKRNPERDRLMAECARLSAEGLSLRAIGRQTGVSHLTVRSLVAEWQMRLPEMTADLIQLATPAVRETTPRLTAVVTNDRNVIPLRRPA